VPTVTIVIKSQEAAEWAAAHPAEIEAWALEKLLAETESVRALDDSNRDSAADGPG
jgi:hypothetical protein